MLYKILKIKNKQENMIILYRLINKNNIRSKYDYTMIMMLECAFT
jgi:hypothetical protein